MIKVRIVAKQDIHGVASEEGLRALDGYAEAVMEGNNLFEIADRFMDENPGYDGYNCEIVKKLLKTVYNMVYNIVYKSEQSSIIFLSGVDNYEQRRRFKTC